METIGKAKQMKLSLFAPNSWNPNELDAQTYESLRYGLQHDGWYASQALLVWGKDEGGLERNIIIDGEHRWKAALELGFETAPTVVLNGLSEAKAKALTIALDQKRGKFNQDKLAEVVKSIQFDPIFEDEELSKSLGFADEQMMKLLAETLPEPPKEDTTTSGPSGTSDRRETPTLPDVPQATTKMVQLFFDEKQHAEFMSYIKPLSVVFGTANVTDTVLAAVRRTHDTEGPVPEGELPEE